jgi:hypothetical protein
MKGHLRERSPGRRAVARIAELGKPQTLSEDTLAQIVEAAVARALVGGSR